MVAVLPVTWTAMVFATVLAVSGDARMDEIHRLTEAIKQHRSDAAAAAERRRVLILELAADEYSDAAIAQAAGITRQAVQSIRTGKRYNPHRRRRK